MAQTPKPSFGIALAAGAINGAYIGTGWCQGKDLTVIASATAAGAVVAAAAEAARIAEGGRHDVARTLGIAAITTMVVVTLGLYLTTPRASADT